MIELPDTPYAVYRYDGTGLPATRIIQVSLEPVYIELPPEFRVRLPTTVYDFKVLQNGDFELGADGSGKPVGWQAISGGDEGLPYSLISKNPTRPETDTNIPLGKYSMLLGNPNYPCSATGVPLGYAAVAQTISIPNVPDGTRLSLDFKYVIYTQDGGADSGDYDRFEVYIDDGGGAQMVFWKGRIDEAVSCANWYRLPQAGWNEASIDLTQPVDYRGKEITISFQNWSRFDHWFNTFTYLDDVRLRIGD